MLTSHAQTFSLDHDPNPIPAEEATESEQTQLTRVCPASNGFGNITFEPRDIGLLHTGDARLNDTCINGCAALLHTAHISGDHSPFAILSTHDLLRIRYKADDNDLWRNTYRSKYWEKAIWILPIHRPSSWGHWVMASIHFDTHQIMLFDSLAERQPWRNDLPVRLGATGSRMDRKRTDYKASRTSWN